MSQSTHQIAIKGKDQTAGAFQSVQNRAKATGAAIRAAVGGAIAAAGAYLSVRAVTGAAKELGKLSDLAMKAGVSVEFLTSATQAFGVAGLNVSAESITKAMQYAQKSVGDLALSAGGAEESFIGLVRKIAAIPDAAERAQATMQIFGQSGLELMPLVNGGQEVIDKFENLRKVMPGVSDAAAAAGDEIADAMGTVSQGVQSLWLRAIGRIARLWADDFPGGVRAGALAAVNWVEYALKKTENALARWGTKIANMGDALANWAVNGYTWNQAWDEYKNISELVDKDFDARQRETERRRKEYLENIAKLDVDDLANALGQRRAAVAGNAADMAAQRSQRISNSLVMGGSNAANRLAILGPQYQNEMKKQTAALEKIAKNTEKTADNTEGDAAASDVAVANF